MRIMTTSARLALYLLTLPDGEPATLSNADLAERLETSGRNVRRCLSQLAAQGAVQVVQSQTYSKEAGLRRVIPIHAHLKGLLTSQS